MSYNPLSDKFLTIATVKTKNGQKDVRVILEIDTNIFYTLDDDGNFIPIAYSLTLPDIRVTGATYSDNTFTFTNNTGGTFTTSFNTLTGLTINGDLNVTGNTLLEGLTATTISATTINGVQANLVSYDNTNSGLSATTVQNAIDELNDGNFQYQNGGVYNTFMVTSGYFGSSSVPFTPGLLLGYPIYVQQNVTIDAIRIGITSFAVGSLVIGLYDCVNGLPNNLLFQSTVFNTGINGYQIITVGNQTIKKGVYYVTYNSNSIPSMLCVNSSSLPNVIGWKNSSGDGAGVIIGRNYAYIGTLPSTWGSVTNIYPASIVTVAPSFEFRII